MAELRVRSSRRPEAVLLSIAVAVTLMAYALVGLGATGSLPPHFPLYSAVVVGVALAAHLVLRRWAPAADPVILPVTLALNGIGLAMIYRIDLARSGTANESHFASRQVIWTLLAMAIALSLLVVLRDHRVLRRFSYTALVAGVLLLLLPLIPKLGQEKRGAQLWVEVFGVSFQPAEIAKVCLAVFFAGYLVTHRHSLALAGPRRWGLRFPRARDLAPLVLAWLISVSVLVSQRDLGTSLLFFGLFLAMLYVATEQISWVLLGCGMFAIGAVAAGSLFTHVAARYNIWLHALDPAVYDAARGGSGQLVRGLFGLASGGLLGTGWGEGMPALVPFAESDFIIASLGEELGLTGLMAILALFLILTQRAMRTAIGVRDGFGKLLAVGLGFTLVLQVFVVVGGVTRVIPLTGLTTPFVAYGGSSLLANWVIVALVLRISDSARRAEAVT